MNTSPMNKEHIPVSLHNLLPLVEKWGIGDDGYREEAIEKAAISELHELVGSICEEKAIQLDRWFVSPEMLDHPTKEYLRYNAFFMAYESAKAELRSRTSKDVK